MVIIFFSTLWSLDRLSWVIRRETLPPSGYVRKEVGFAQNHGVVLEALNLKEKNMGGFGGWTGRRNSCNYVTISKIKEKL